MNEIASADSSQGWTDLPDDDELRPAPKPVPPKNDAEAAPPAADERAIAAGHIEIGTNERVAFVGHTRSGKSTLAEWYLSKVQNVDVFIADTKGDPGLLRFARRFGYYEASSLCLPSDKYPRVIVRGPADGEWWDPAFDAIVERGRPCLIYLDEFTHLTTPWYIGDGLKKCFVSGGGRGVGVWVSTQRPVGVSSFAFSEVDHIFSFRLSRPADEKTMADQIRFPDRKFSSNDLPRWGFVYHTAGMRSPVTCQPIKPIA